MLSKIKLTLLLFLIPILLLAQRNTQHKLGIDNLYPSEAVATFDLRERTTHYQVFYNDEWKQGQLFDKEGQILKGEFLIKYDILNQDINISISKIAYVAPMNNIGGFLLYSIEDGELKNHVFVYDKLSKNNKNVFFEVVENGDYELRIFHSIEKLKPNYIPALDTGNLNEKIIRKNFFYLKDEKGLHKIPKKKKGAIKFFQSYSSARRYLKKNKVNFKKLEELKKLIRFMNQEKNN